MDTVEQIWSHKLRTEVKNHFSQPTDYVLANATQYVVGLLCHKSTAELCSTCSALGHAGVFLLARLLSSLYVLRHGIISSQIQDLVPTSVELQKVPVSPLISPTY